MPYQAPPDLAGLDLIQIAELVAARRLPPVEQWDPPEQIDSLMRIDKAGHWYHAGRPLSRAAMVRAFSGLLMRDSAGQHWLMTPQCRQSIMVEDAAFIAVDMAQRDGTLAFRLNTDELVLAGPDHGLRAVGDPDCPAVYLSVRHGCEARVDRSTWLQLAEHALALGDTMHVTSQGRRFSLVPA